jgi:hypothetical protein
MTQPQLPVQSDIDRAWAFIQVWEGGSTFTNDPRDPGGATRWGVTQKVFNAWRLSKGQGTMSVQFCTEEEAKEIFVARYWNGLTDHRPWPLNMVLCDTAYNCGPGRATRWLNIEKAGVSLTDPLRMKRLAQMVLIRRVSYYRALGAPGGSMNWALAGWLNRSRALAKLTGLRMPN